MKQIEILQRTFQFRNDHDVYFCTATRCDQALNVREISYVKLINGHLPISWQQSWRTTSNIADIIPEPQHSSLNGPYQPAADDMDTLNTIIPDSMDDGMREALGNLKKAVGGDVSGFVCERLHMSRNELRNSLKAEQVDAVALAIYNIEMRQQGIIIGDQTGIGKGRQAAAMIRYAVQNDIIPIFITVKASLFSDLYRDCKALGIADYRPFIFNNGAIMVDYEGKVKETNRDYEAEISDLNEQLAAETDEKKQEKIQQQIEKIELEQQKNTYEIVYEDSHDLAKSMRYKTDKYDYICATYSQFNTKEYEKHTTLKGVTTLSFVERKPKNELLRRICSENKVIFIIDEAHNASNLTSNTGIFFNRVLSSYQYDWEDNYQPFSHYDNTTKGNYQVLGAVYLSATFAKRSDNMWLYAKRTSLGETNLTNKELIDVMNIGGNPMQEVVSENLVRSGQMVRRERGFENIDVRYIKLDSTANDWGIENTSIEDRIKSDIVANTIRRIVDWEHKHLEAVLNAIIQYYMLKGSIVYNATEEKTYGDMKGSPVFSRIFNFIDQMQLAIKSRIIAERTIRHVREGKKVVIAINKTGETMIRNCKAIDPITRKELKTVDDKLKEIAQYKTDEHEEINIKADFGSLVTKLLDGSLSFVGADSQGHKTAEKFNGGNDMREFGKRILEEDIDGRIDYNVIHNLNIAADEFDRVYKDLSTTEFNLPLSPIDYITQLINREGIKVAECTGRKTKIIYDEKDLNNGKFGLAKVVRKEKGNTGRIYNDFQNNRVDVMILNSSGATGQSAHAVPTNEVPAEKVKQRVMIIGQSELDVAVEIQKRGRINRTGQIFNPIYEYITTSIPAEERNLMILKRKLKSLDSNTNSDQKANDKQLDAVDFQNKYGDVVVKEWLDSNPSVQNVLLIKESDEKYRKNGYDSPIKNFAQKALGRLPALDCKEQQRFFDEITKNYEAYVEELKADDNYDLECEEVDYRAKLLGSDTFRPANQDCTGSIFGSAAFENNYQCELKAKPLDLGTIAEMIKKNDFDKDKWLKGAREYLIEREKEFNERQNKLTPNVDEDEEEFELKKQERIEKEKEKLNAKYNRFVGGLSWFKAGEVYRNFPPLDTDDNKVMAVCLGYSIRSNSGNIYTDSNIEVRFAVTHERKVVRYNFVLNDKGDSGWNKIFLVRSANHYSTLQNSNGEIDTYVLEAWRDKCRNLDKIRQQRKIIEGNILGAFCNPILSSNATSVRVIRFTDEKGEKHLGLQYKLKQKDKNVVKTIALPANAARKYTNATCSFAASSVKRGNLNIISDRGCPYFYVTTKPSDTFGQYVGTRAFIDFTNGKIEFIQKKSEMSTKILRNTEQEDIFWRLMEKFDFYVQVPATYIDEAEMQIIERRGMTLKWPTIQWDSDNIPHENNAPDTSQPIVTSSNRQRQLFFMAEAEAEARLRLLKINRKKEPKNKKTQRQSVAGFADIFVENPRTQRVRDFIEEARQQGKRLINVVLHRGHYDLYCDNFTRWNSIYTTPIANADPELIYQIIERRK